MRINLTLLYAFLIGLGTWLIFSADLMANNLQVKEVQLTGQNVGSQFTLIQFDISWENSWRYSAGPANWDAAWIFVKFRVGSGDWQHASINYVDGTATNDGHSEPVGATITTPSDGVGVFLHRANDGSGDVSWENVALRWNYGADGVGNNAYVDVEVFAIEMVYVPQGSYQLGGGTGSEQGKFFEGAGPLNFTTPYEVTSEAPIVVGPGVGQLYYFGLSGEAGDQGGPIPTQFPKGYDAFYCMKYEVTQAQWVTFFNSLTQTQKTNNDLTDLDHRGPNGTDRNEVNWDGSNGASTEHPSVPITFLLWGEILAYMDWAGLRPMTELEFVKACRGPLPTIPEGYAWGTPNLIDSDYTYDLMDKRTEKEELVNPVSGIGNANWLYSALFEDGPYRSGIFAASAKYPRREDAGASFFGLMEMTGNVSEMAITIGTPQGRAFRSNHGDGELDTNGEANVSFWPPITGEGGGLFGGSWFSLGESLWINDRRDATAGNVGYFNDVGFRCVRTAP